MNPEPYRLAKLGVHYFGGRPESAYALMVFDQAMIQFGGLAYTVSRNKITAPQDAALLAGLTAKWLLAIAQDLGVGGDRDFEMDRATGPH